MRPVLIRALGYFVPTVILITASHVEKDPRPGEWLDGVVSGSWFALCFLAAALVLGALARALGRPAGGPAARELGLGLLTAVLAWFALWAFWQVPATAPLRALAFVVNSAAMALAAVVAASLAARTRRRPALASA
jgi:hypothetical protein